MHEDLEDQKFAKLEFIELNACSGGCVGGVLTVENPYVAKVKLKRLRKYMPVACNHLASAGEVNGYWTEGVEYVPVFKLGENMKESIAMMNQVDVLCEKFPGLDCGSCGAPTCQTLAEDIVRGEATPNDCIYVLRSNIADLSQKIESLTQGEKTGKPLSEEEDEMLRRYIKELTTELASFGVPGNYRRSGQN